MKGKIKSIILTITGAGLALLSVVGVQMMNTQGKTYGEIELNSIEFAQAEQNYGSESANGAPVISFPQRGGELLAGSKVKITATDPENDNIKKITYFWDYATNREEGYVLSFNSKVGASPCTTEVDVPTTTGLHLLRAWAEDANGNVSQWLSLPYYVVNKLSGTKDTTAPTFDFSTLPSSGTTLKMGQKIKIKAVDNESGIYYIAYAWADKGTVPEFKDYTIVFEPENGELEVTVPDKYGDKELYFYAANATIDANTNKYMTSNAWFYQYGVKDEKTPTLSIDDENNNYEIEVGTTIPTYSASATDNVDQNVTVSNNASEVININKTGEYTVTFTAQDKDGNITTDTRTVTVKDTVAPQIKLKDADGAEIVIEDGKATDTVELGTTYSIPTAEAIDADENANATVSTNKTEEEIATELESLNTGDTFTITYTATDGTNESTVELTVTVKDTVAPQIKLKDANETEIEIEDGKATDTVVLGTTYNIPTAEAIDADANATVTANKTAEEIATELESLNTGDTFTITYTATDGINESTVELTVKVIKEITQSEIDVLNYETEFIYDKTSKSVYLANPENKPEGLTISIDENENKRTDVGTTDVTITYGLENDNYIFASDAQTTKTVTLTVNKRNITNNIAKIKEVTYNGEAQIPVVESIKDGNDNELELTTEDYTLMYTNITDAGTKNILVIGKGNYTGSVSAEYKINAAETTLTSKVTSESEKISEEERENKIEYKETGLTVQNSVTSNVSNEINGTYTYQLVNSEGEELDNKIFAINEDGEITLNNKIGKQNIKVTFTPESANYKESTTIFEVEVLDKIEPALKLANTELSIDLEQQINVRDEITKEKDTIDGDMTGKTTISITPANDETPADGVALDENGVVTANKLGTYTVTYKLTDNSGNETTKTLTLTVGKRELKEEEIKAIKVTPKETKYTGNEIEVTVENLPEGVTQNDINIEYEYTMPGQENAEENRINNVLNAGKYQAYAVITEGTYTKATTEAIQISNQFEIKKAEYDVSTISFIDENENEIAKNENGVYERTVVYDGKAHSIKIDVVPEYITTITKTRTNNNAEEVTNKSITSASKNGKYEYIVKFVAPETQNYKALDYEVQTVLTINKKSLEDEDIQLTGIEDKTFTGSPIEQDIVLTNTTNNKELVKGTDYKVTYENNVNVGTATVTITGTVGKQNFTGTITREFKINPKTLTLDMFNIAIPENGYTYNGNAQEPTVTVKETETSLTENDYEVKYENSTNAGTAKVVITAKGNFTIPAEENENAVLEKEYTINAKEIAESMVSVTLPEEGYIFDNTEKQPEVIVKDGEKVLENGENKDYIITFTDNKNAGTATITVNGQGNYQGTVTKTFEIVKQAITLDSKIMVGTDEVVESNGEFNTSDKDKNIVIEPNSSVSEEIATISYTQMGGNGIINSESLANGKVELTGKPGNAAIIINAKATDENKANYKDASKLIVIKVTDNDKPEMELVDKLSDVTVDTTTDLAWPTVTDNSGEDITPVVTYEPAKGYETIENGLTINQETHKVTANKVGKYVITYTATDSKGNTTSLTRELTVNIIDLTETEITVTPNEDTTLNCGNTKNVTVTLNKAELNNENLSYSSSNEDVAEIVNNNDGTATITAKSLGETEITVSYLDDKNTYTKSFKITVNDTEAPTLTKIFVDGKEATMDLADKNNIIAKVKTSAKIPTITVEATDNVTSSDKISVEINNTAVEGKCDKYDVIITLSDEAGNKTVATQKIQVYRIALPVSSIIVTPETTTYTGNKINVEPSVKEGTPGKIGKATITEIKYSKDGQEGYTTVSEVKEAGHYKVKVDVKETTYYTQTTGVEREFTINEKSISNLAIEPIADQNYTGEEIKPTVVVKDGETTLTEGTDYEVAYSNNINAGTATVTITGKENFSEEITANFTINKVAYPEANLAIAFANKSKSYNDKKFEAITTIPEADTYVTAGDITYKKVTVENEEKTYAEIEGAPIEVGTYVAEVTFTVAENTNYNEATITKTSNEFIIKPLTENYLTVENIADQTYTGSELTPEVTVKNKEKVLTKGTDYDVEYSNNVDTGTGKATITFKGNYTGTKTVEFNIGKKAITLETIQLEDSETTYKHDEKANIIASLKDAINNKLPENAEVEVNEITLTKNEVAAGETLELGNYDITASFKLKEGLNANNYTLPENQTVGTINVIDKITGIEIVSAPTASTKYGTALENIDLTGATYKEVYRAGTTGTEKAITAEMLSDGETAYNPNTLDEQTIKVTVNTIDGEFTANMNIQLEDYVDHVEISGMPESVEYGTELNEIDLTETTVQKIMASGTEVAAESITTEMIEGYEKTPSMKDENNNTVYEVTESIKVNYAGKSTDASIKVVDTTAPTLTKIKVNGKEVDKDAERIAKINVTDSIPTIEVEGIDNVPTTIVTSNIDTSAVQAGVAGNYNVQITLSDGNKENIYTRRIKIERIDLDNEAIIVTPSSTTYTGSEIGLKASILDGTAGAITTPTIVEGSLKYSATGEEGSFVAIDKVQNIGYYQVDVSMNATVYYNKKEITKTFRIASKSISNVTIDAIADQNYTGEEIKPTVVVKDGETTLTEGTDYEVAYSNNINAGTATVKVTGKDNYSEEITANFTINKVAYPEANLAIAFDGTSKTYSGNTYKAKTTIPETDTYVTAGDITYKKVTVENEEKTYTAIEGAPVEAGTYVAEVTFTVAENTNYNETTITKTTSEFTIAQKPFFILTVENIADQTYTGSKLTPEVTVKDGEKALTKGIDYDVEYSDNVNVGTGKATITFKGNYTGTKTVEFNIDKKVITLGEITLNENETTVEYDDKANIIASLKDVVNNKLPENAEVEVDEVILLRNENVAGETLELGNYDVTVSFKLKEGFDEGNYTLPAEQSVGTINVVDKITGIVIEGTLTNKNKYGTAFEELDLTGLTYKEVYKTEAQSDAKQVTIGMLNKEEYNAETLDNQELSVTLNIGENQYTANTKLNIKLEDYMVGAKITGMPVQIEYNKVLEDSDFENVKIQRVMASGAVKAATTVKASMIKGYDKVPSMVDEEGNYLSEVTENVKVNYGGMLTDSTIKVVDTTAPVITAIKVDEAEADLENDVIKTIDVTDEIPEITVEGTDNVVTSDKLKATVDTTAVKEGRAGTYDVVITLSDGHYTTTVTKQIVIKTIDMGNGKILITPTSETYTGNTIGITPSMVEGIPGVLGTPSIVENSLKYSETENGLYSEANEIKNAGYYKATVNVSATTYYNAKNEEVTFAISKKSMTSNDITIEVANCEYTGEAQEPTVTVKDNETVLNKGTDYTISYNDNTDKGTATVTVTGIGNYTGNKEQTFTIGAKSMTSNDITIEVADCEYNGENQTPIVTVKDNETELSLDTDYTVSYTNNKNAGTATVTVTGIGNYTGNKDQTFTISKKAITVTPVDAEKVYGEDDPEKYNYTISGGLIGGEQLSKINFTRAEGEIKSTYVISMTDKNKEKANNANSNYDITFETGTFTINAKPISIPEAATGLIYNGKEREGIKEGTEYIIKTEGTNNATSAGTYIAIVELKDKNNTTWNDGTIEDKEIEWTIAKRKITENMISNIADQTYTGSEITPSLKITDNSRAEGEETLLLTTDYTVTYENNVNAGIATAIIKGNGNYTTATEENADATVSKEFTILPKELENNAEKYTVVINTQRDALTGEYITPIITITDVERNTPLVKATTVGNVTIGDYSVEYGDYKTAGTATAVITGNGNYTGTINVGYQVAQRILNGTITLGENQEDEYSVEYNGEAQEPKVTLGEYEENKDYTVLYTSNKDAGTATVIVTGKGNFKGSLSKTFTITTRAINNNDNITVSDIADQEYTGSEIKPTVTVKDNGTALKEGKDYEVVFNNNTQVGTADVTITGIGNYEGEKLSAFRITKRNLANTTVTLSKTEYDLDDESDKKPVVTVKDGNVTLVQDVDYTVEYPEDLETAGTKTITISAVENGNYTGTNTATYTILATETEVTLQLRNEDNLTQTITKGDNYESLSSSKFKMTPAKATLIVKENTVDTNTVGKYTVTYVAKYNDVESAPIETTVIVKDSAPYIEYRQGNSTPAELTNGAEFYNRIKVSFNKGTAKLYENGSETGMTITSGTTLSDGEYKLVITTTEEDETLRTSTTVKFTVNTQGPTVYIGGSAYDNSRPFYDAPVILSFENIKNINSVQIYNKSESEMTVLSKEAGNINSTNLTLNGGQYSILVTDNQGRETYIDNLRVIE